MAQLVLHRRAARYFERLEERLKAQLLFDQANDRVIVAHIGPRGDITNERRRAVILEKRLKHKPVSLV